MTHHPPHLRRAAVALGAALLLAGPLAACSSSGSDAESSPTSSVQAAYCGAWDDVVEAFAGFDDLDLVNDGLGSVRSYLDDLGESLQTFADAADAKLRPQVDDLEAAIQGLADAVAGDADLGDAATELRSSWDALVKALREDCPESDTGS